MFTGRGEVQATRPAGSTVLFGGLPGFCWTSPRHEARDPLGDSNGRVKAKDILGFCDVRAGNRHVAGNAIGIAADGRLAHGFFDEADDLVERDRERVAEVEYVVAIRGFICHGCEDTGDNILDPGVVASAAAVAKQVDRLAVPDHANKLVDCQVGTLPRSVDGEEAQGDTLKSVTVDERVQHRFAGQLGRGVRRCGAEHKGVFAERNDAARAINGA